MELAMMILDLLLMLTALGWTIAAFFSNNTAAQTNRLAWAILALLWVAI